MHSSLVLSPALYSFKCTASRIISFTWKINQSHSNLLGSSTTSLSLSLSNGYYPFTCTEGGVPRAYKTADSTSSVLSFGTALRAPSLNAELNMSVSTIPGLMHCNRDVSILFNYDYDRKLHPLTVNLMLPP